jgi:hypothetical protein
MSYSEWVALAASAFIPGRAFQGPGSITWLPDCRAPAGCPVKRRAVIDRQVLGPYDMEQDLGMIGGNIFHGELSLD